MASNLASRNAAGSRFDADRDAFSLRDTVTRWVAPLASLKLTVVLFAMSIFLVLAGTVAQIDDEIWVVMSRYFRTFVAWIPLQVFFPRSIAVPGVLPFPGGWTIGGLLMINLLAAHLTRFKIQARGVRLWAGIVVIALGIVTTWLVIVSGNNMAGSEGLPLMPWSTMWEWFRASLVGLTLAALGGAILPKRMNLVVRILLAVLAFGLGALTTWLYWRGGDAALGDSSMRILWQLIKGASAGLVLLAGCVLVFRKRGGIVLLHAGVGLLMFNELFVGLTNIETQMHINEGETVNYAQDIRAVELAVVDPSPAGHDLVTVIPGSIWNEEQIIRDDRLPFDIEVLDYLPNTELIDARTAPAGTKNLATAGEGLHTIAREVAHSVGTDSGGNVDVPAAYVRFLRKGTTESLGTHLISVAQALQQMAEMVTVDGHTYDVYLRFERHYKPYTVHLVDARHDVYEGTTKAKNYSSDVRLVDPAHNVDRDVHIWMNNPLRYNGETLYQSGMNFDQRSGTSQTVLQVVKNTGWMIPYVACMLVVVGMLAHFLIVLVRFLNRQSERAVTTGPAVASPWWIRWGFPLAVVAMFGGYVLGKARMPTFGPDEYDVVAFGRLPLLYEGRVKPFDTLARNSLRIISGKEEWRDNEGHKQPAIQWLLDAMTSPFTAAQHKVVRIDSPEVLNTLGLEPRPGFMYAISEFQDKMPEFERQSQLAHDLKADQQSFYQRKILELDERLRLYTLILKSFDQPQMKTEKQRNEARDEARLLVSNQAPRAVPPATADGHWEPYYTGWATSVALMSMGQQPNPAVVDLNAILVDYSKHKPKEFNQDVASYTKWLAANPPPLYDAAKIGAESFFNQFAPFYYALVPYVAAFVLTCLGWLGWREPLHRAAFWLIVFTFAIHTAALITRIYISGRPPVTNLYSSAIFIGWGAVLLGIVLEAVFKLGIGNCIAAVAGFATLLIAHMLSASGDTLIVLEAVLDTQFWLATHVVCITLGYTTTYVAGLLGLVYVAASFARRMGRDVPEDLGKTLGRMIYGILCFAILFSFFGTVLGGLWADDSWGRFWGWDPKENGALIIVIWNALVLHARWGGMVKDRGLALLAIAGNIAVSWSWFGVNNLGKGLHSYGFTEGVAWALLGFAVSQVVIIAIGALLPRLGERPSA